MDYPKSVASAGLVNGRFVDEDPEKGTPGSLIPAGWGNLVTQEILNVVKAAGLTPDEVKEDQLVSAVKLFVDFTIMKNKPVTLGGYGITDALEVGQALILAPPGMVAYFAMPGAPAGWLKANGASVNRVAYASLFSAVGTTYGTGDGTSTFKLPDLRGEFLRCWDDGRAVDSGRQFGSSQAHAIQSHSHTVAAYQANDFNSGGGITSTDDFYSGPYNFSTSSVGGAETRPRNIALLACIKY